MSVSIKVKDREVQSVLVQAAVVLAAVVVVPFTPLLHMALVALGRNGCIRKYDDVLEIDLSSQAFKRCS